MYLNTKTEIASYAKFISKQANLGNEEAIKILKDSGRDLAVLVRRVYKNLGLTEKAIIGFRGSFVQKAPYVKEELMKNLDGFGIHLNIFEGDQDPVFGAFYMARRKGKI
jgi:N-acetylglucosamine kinase-like BadF-type ATPase